MPRLTLITSAFSFLLLLSACTTPRPPSQTELITDDYSLVKEYMAKYIRKEMNKGDITGLSIALIDDQRIVWSEGFGLADKVTGRPSKPETLYRAGSVSKLFTAIAVMQLVETGTLDLDAPLVDYVPEFDIKSRHGSTQSITLRNILSHHSGIPDSIVDGMWSDNPDSFKTVASRLGEYYTASQPNTVFAYSNAGYSLAGHAVENSSGVPFAEYTEQNVLGPLKMDVSNISLNTSSALLSKSYWKGDEVPELGLRDTPAGGLVTNVLDLSRLVMAMHSLQAGNSGILDPGSFSVMISPQTHNSPYIVDNMNGIGFFVDRRFLNGQYIAAGHDGQTMAHSASLISIPELKLGVVILGNSPNLTGIYQNISEELLKVAYPVKTGRSLKTSSDPVKTPLPGLKTDFDGDYTSPFGFVRVSRDSSTYKVRIGDEKMLLKPDKSGGYKLSVKLFGPLSISPGPLKKLRFYPREINSEKLVVMDTGTNRQLIATQASKQMENAVWHARLGKYVLINPIDTDIDMFKFDNITLEYNDGYYMITSSDGESDSSMPLSIMNDNEATIQGRGRGLGETIFVTDDGTIVHAGLKFIKL